MTQKRVGKEGVTLAEVCEAALTLTDNTGNLRLASLGGSGGVSTYARSLGDRATRLDRMETSLNQAMPGDRRDARSPAAMAANLHALSLGRALSPRLRDQLTAWLVANQTGDARLRAGCKTDFLEQSGLGDSGLLPPQSTIPPAQG